MVEVDVRSLRNQFMHFGIDRFGDYENTDDSNDDAGDDTAYGDSHDSSFTKVYQIRCFQNISVFRQWIRPRLHDVTTWKKVRH